MASAPVTDLFYTLQKAAYDATTRLFGYVATWNDGAEVHTATVHFQNPTEGMRLAGIDYDATEWRMEYRLEDFDGLKALADARTAKPIVTIGDTAYHVTRVQKKHDGRTYYATLQPVPPTPPAP